MAIPIADPTPLIPSAAASTYTVDVSGLGAIADDYVMCFIACSAFSGTVSENSGGGTTWTLTTLYVGIGNRMLVAYAKVAAGPTISNPRFALSAGTGLWQGAIVAIRDADATTFSAGSSTDDPAANVTNRATAALTPSSDNALVFYFVSPRTGSGAMFSRFLPSDVVGQVIQQHDDGSTFMAIALGTVQQTTAAATAKTYYNSLSARTGAIVFAVKNKTSGQLSPHGTAGFTKVAWHGDFGVHDTTLTWGAPDADTIGAYTVSTDATTAVAPSTGAAAWGAFSQISSAVNSAGIWVGRKASFSGAINMAGKQFYTEFFFVNLGTQIGDQGAVLQFRDSSGYWAAFQLIVKASLLPGFVYSCVIDVDTVTPYATGGGGSIVWTDVVAITALYHRAGLSGTARNINFRNWALLSRTTLVGGGAIRPLTIGYAKNVLNGWGFVGCTQKLGETVLPKCDIQIGDGTFPTYYDSSATGVTYEGEFSALSQPAVNIAASGIEFRIKASSSDTIIDAASATTAQLAQGWVIDSASSGSATYSFVGKVISGMASPTLLAGETFTSMTFSECGPVQTKGASLTSCTVSATTASSTEAAVSVDANGSTLLGSTTDVTGTDAGYHLELAAGVKDISLTNHTFTGSAATNKVHVLKTAATVAAGAFVTGDHYEIKTVGTTDFTAIGASANTIGVRFTATGAGSGTGDAYVAVKITTSGTTSLVEADVTSAGAEIWVAAPQPTLDAVVLANTRAVLWNRTTAAELDNTFVAGTTWSKVITSGASSGDVLDLYTFKEGYAEARSTIIYSGDDATFAVEQAVDDAIDYYRTQESITDYTTLTEYNFYAPDIYIQADDADGENKLKRLFVFYNGALTTEDGARHMRGGITFNSPFDVVINRSVRAIAVDNVSATYGLHFTDEDTIRVTTDDGTSWIAPPSAPGSIRYAFGVSPGQIETGVSGVTAQDITDIADAAATAVVGNSKTLTVPKFLGLK